MSQTPAELARRLRALTARRAGLAVCLWGEPGIGKTFCVQALLRETPCRSQSLPARLPLTALARSLPRPSRLPVWAEQVLEQLHHGELVDDLRTLNAVAAVLAGLAPFVLHLEDLHEAGPHEQKQAVALARLVTRMRGVGWLATSRTPPPEGTEGLQLLPLDADASGALLETEAGTALPEPALAWISQRAAGNPLFTLEYFRLLARQGHLWNNAQRWHWRPPLPDLMPLTVEAMIEQVLMTAARLPIQQRALEARALLGPDISPGIRDSGADGALWARVAALSAGELAEARAALEGLRILAGHGFSHPLYREVALRRLSAPERRRLARRALEALHAEPRKAAAFVESADLDPAEALRWFEQAAQEAGAGPQGARFLARAVPYAQGEHRAALAQEAAQHLRDFDAPEALRLAELAVAAAPADPAPSFLLAELLAGQGRLQEAELLLNTLPETGRTDAARLSRLIRLRASARDTAGVLKLWSRLSELHADPEPEVASAVAFALSVHGQPSAASALASRLLTRPDLDSAPSCELINVLGTSCYAVNDFVGAVEHHSRAVVQAQAAGLTRLEALFLSNRALALGELGRHRERMQDLEASLQLHAASGQMLQVSRTQVAVADACLDLAQYERAEELLLECRAALSRLPPSDHLTECEYRLSVLYRNWAPPHGGLLSLKHAHAALTYAQQTENPRKLAWSLAYAAIAESCFGDSGQGLALATQALALSGSLQAPGQLGMARFAQAYALEASGQHSAALHAFEQLEADLKAQGITDAAQEVGLEADRLAGRADRAAARVAWFREHEMFNLVTVACRYFPELSAPAALNRVSSGESALRLVEAGQHLVLEVLGPLRCGPTGEAKAVRGRKRRELLAALLEARLRGRPDLSRTDLLGLLYPETLSRTTDEVQAAASLRELVHTTRLALGTAVVQTTPSGYALGEVSSDAEAFLAGGRTQLWRGGYLQDAAPAGHDEAVGEALYLALRARIEAILQTDPHEAARSARLLLEADPYDLAALRLALRALRASGNHRSLSRLYAEACANLQEVGEQLPAHWTDFLNTPG